MHIHFPHARRALTLFLIGIILSGCMRLPATGAEEQRGADEQRGAENQRGADEQRGAKDPRGGVIPEGPRLVPQITAVAGVRTASELAGAPEGSLKSSITDAPACVAGDWQVSDLADTMRGSYDESPNTQTLTLDSVDGQVRYHFDPSGSLEIRYEELVVTLSGSIDGQPATVQQALHGSASARYEVDASGNSLVVTDFGGEGVQFAFDINGQRLAEGSLPAWRVFVHALSGGLALTPSPLIRYSRLAITCGDNTLTMRPVEPFSGTEVKLSRLRE